MVGLHVDDYDYRFDDIRTGIWKLDLVSAKTKTGVTPGSRPGARFTEVT